MYLLIASSLLAGIATKYVDEYVDGEKVGKEMMLLMLVISTIFVSYLVYSFPDIMMGVILGVTLMGKTSNKYQAITSIAPFGVFLYKLMSASMFSFPLLFYATALSILDESKYNLKGNRPWVPIGLIFLLILVSTSIEDGFLIEYIGLATISLLCFDIGYKVTSLSFKTIERNVMKAKA